MQLIKKDAILELQEAIGKEPQFECPTKHVFIESQYIRQLFIPAGVLIVGKRHRHKTLNILLKGKMLIHDGYKTVEVEAPYMVEAKEFTKKAGYAIEDSIWCNIHVTNETDLDRLEQEFIITEEDYQLLIEHKD